jgi:hypothetical protein
MRSDFVFDIARRVTGTLAVGGKGANQAKIFPQPDLSCLLESG